MAERYPMRTRLFRRGVRQLNKIPVAKELEQLIVSGYLKPILGEGHISVTEAQSISATVKSLSGKGPIIEIGTLFGFSTMILTIAKEKERELITVDSFFWNPLHLSSNNHFDLTSSYLASATAGSNVSLIRLDKDEFFKTYKGPKPSMIFLDADHEYQPTLHDIKESKRLGAEVICGHDYRPDWPGVIQAVEECGGASLLADTFWVLKQ